MMLVRQMKVQSCWYALIAHALPLISHQTTDCQCVNRLVNAFGLSNVADSLIGPCAIP